MAVYEIRVKGHLDGRWSEWFDGLEICNADRAVLPALLGGEAAFVATWIQGVNL